MKEIKEYERNPSKRYDLREEFIKLKESNKKSVRVYLYCAYPGCIRCIKGYLYSSTSIFVTETGQPMELDQVWYCHRHRKF